MNKPIYRGYAVPFKKGPKSFPQEAVDDDVILSSILTILSTSRGERLMRPEFATNLYDFVFENNNESLEELLATEARTALAKFEPRIIVSDVSVLREETTITLTLVYVTKATNKRGQLSLEIPLLGQT